MPIRPKLYAVILAGGGGTRLWPLSRQKRPKHLQSLCGDDCLIAQTQARIAPIVDDRRILVVTVAGQAEGIRAALPMLPAENIVTEPVGRNTAPCLGLMAKVIASQDPEAVMAALPADHAVQDVHAFRSALLAAADAAEDGHLVTLGIHPTTPETGFGYIERGQHLGQLGGHDVYRVSRFTEKPDLPTARSFLASKRYYWNSGMFVWKASALLAEIRRLLPEVHAVLEALAPDIGTQRQAEAVERVWPRLPSISIDYGVMEHAQDVVVVPSDFGWSDVGSWTAVGNLAKTDKDGNVAQGNCELMDCRNTVVFGEGRLVAAIGLEDMIVVESGNALLVCPKSRAQDVKKLVEKLQRDGRTEYL